jgi:hypothetical protein
LILFDATFTSFFKDEKSIISHKSMFLLHFLLGDRRIRILIRTRYLVLMDPDPRGPKTYLSYGSGSAALLFRVYYNKVLTGSVVVQE